MRLAMRLRLQCLILIVLGCAIASPPAHGRNNAVILRGGTYSGGEYSSLVINTPEPVVVENMTLRGSGILISSHYQKANLTLRNVRAYGPDDEQHAGRFVSLEGFANVRIENCHLERTQGIYLLDYAGDGTPANTVKILRNRSRNIDGRRGGGGRGGKVDLVQFVQLDKVRGVPEMEIAWNEVVNEPGQSAVEDNINIYLSGGTPDSPLNIHDNFIRGGYASDPARGEYSGGGILLGDGNAEPEKDARFVVAIDNQVLDTTNYGIAIAAGHDCRIERNRIVSAGVMPDGKTPIAAQNVGVYIWDSYKTGEKRFYNNSGKDNLVGWVKQGNDGNRNDWWAPHAARFENNTRWPGQITLATYDDEFRRWQQKCAAKGVTVGAVEK
jgi:hypothetical protein